MKPRAFGKRLCPSDRYQMHHSKASLAVPLVPSPRRVRVGDANRHANINMESSESTQMQNRGPRNHSELPDTAQVARDDDLGASNPACTTLVRSEYDWAEGI